MEKQEEEEEEYGEQEEGQSVAELSSRHRASSPDRHQARPPRPLP